MNAYESDTNESIELDDRDARALEQYLTVLEDIGRVKGAEDLYLVVSQSGKEYLVDTREGRCECPDHRHRGEMCKHLRRVAIVTGARAISTDVLQAADVDPQLAEHVDSSPKVVTSDGGIIEAGDDGEILDDNDGENEAYTYHREPRAQGGARYVRCEGCGREVVPADPEKLLHKESCPNARDRDDTPRRSEPADFGGGESTGVQDL